MEQHALTISDVAQALNLSKTTVSRAISGKGRISEATRLKVQQYISQHNYQPNAVARGLAQNKTYNIALVISPQFTNFDLPFLRKSMASICREANHSEYDILLTFAENRGDAPLRRLLDKGKLDGVILSSAIENDPMTKLLQERGLPFVVIGHLSDPTILQVDNDQVAGCRELTGVLLKMGMRRIALLGGSPLYTVNNSRLEGYAQAHSRVGLPLPSELIYTGLESTPQREMALEQALQNKPDCILCMDDNLSLLALKYLKGKGIRVPQDLCLASMYDSEELAETEPGITALQFDADNLARTAYRVLLERINGNPVHSSLELGYQLILRHSTL